MKANYLFKLNILTLLLIISPHVYSQATDPATNTAPAVNNNVQVDTLTSEATSTTPDQQNNNTLSTQEDMTITNSIKSEISKSSVLSQLPVTVSTANGVVTFSGNVDSDSQASSLVELAQSVIGVKDINAEALKVKESSQPFQDMLITAKVKGLFIREDVFGTKDIASINLSVETKDGVVYLTGVIDNPQQLENAKKLIQGVSGVKSVEYIVKKVTVNDQQPG